MKRLLLFLLALCWTGSAYASCPYPLTIKDAAGTTQNMSSASDPAGNCYIPAGTFDTGSGTTQTATPGNSVHAAGTSIGGLFTIPVARLSGGSGIITNILWTGVNSTNDKVSIQVRLWDKSPAATTCTDGSAFVSSTTDDQHLIMPPTIIAVSIPSPINTGDPKVYGWDTGVNIDFRNQDSAPTQNVYACVLPTANWTGTGVAGTGAVYLSLSGTQN